MSTAKRMRLGTKSCAECRRRKVRCIPSSSPSLPGAKCEACISHGTECYAQNAQNAETDEARLKQRVAELEHLVVQLQTAAPTPKTSVYASPSQTIGSNTPSKSYDGTPLISKQQQPREDLPTQHGEDFENAPLLRLFSSANIGSRQNDEIILESGWKRRQQELTTALAEILPNQLIIQSVIRDSERYFACWPSYSFGSRNELTLRAGEGQEAYNVITQSLLSTNPTVVAKAILFFCKCLAQLNPSAPARRHLPSNLVNLIDEYICIASSLLHFGSFHSDTVDGVEAYMLLFKLAIDLGKPRLAWKSARAAVEIGLLMGYHLPTASTIQKTLWRRLWQLDRQPSVILGLPCAIPNSHPTLQEVYEDLPMLERIGIEINTLFGDLAETERSPNVDDEYAACMSHDVKAANIFAMFPPQWKDPQTVSRMPLEVKYNVHQATLRHHSLLRHLHLPWMLKSAREPNYSQNRKIALEASKSVARVYIAMKSDDQLRQLICELMDMECFSSCITIVVGTLLLRNTSAADFQTEKDDFALLDECLLRLQQTADLFNCSIARQSSMILNYLLKALRKEPDIPNEFETAVPFFGQMRIKRPEVTTDIGDVNPGDLAAAPQQYSGSLIEFGVGLNYQWPAADDCLGGIDWQTCTDWDCNFEWNEVFKNTDFSFDMST